MAVTDQWYCGVDGQQYGPYTWDQLRSMAAEGRIVPETYVRREIDKQWLSAAQIPGLLARKKGVAKTSPTAAPAKTTAAAVPTASAEVAAADSGTKKLQAARPLAAAVTPAVVGTAVSGSAIPAGQSMPAAPVGVAVAPMAGGGSPPVGPPLGFAINTDSPAKSFAAVGDEIEPTKKGGSLVLVGVLGGAAMAVAIVGMALVVWTWTRPPTSDADALAESEPTPEAVESASKANPDGTKAAEGTSNERAAAARSVAAAKKVLEAQAKWGNVERYSIKLNDVHVKVTGVWLAADEAGTWVEPQLPDAAASAAAAGSAPPARYVFVEVRLFNGGGVPRKFRSWNASDPLAAVMADDEGDVLAPVPASATPGVTRLSSLRLLPNQAISDTLVFEAPDDPFETLKLALGYSALTERSSRHIAFEVPVEVLFRKRGGAAGGTALAADQSPAAAATGVAAAPQPAGGDAKMPAKTAKTNRPPSKEELNKQFEELDKTTPAAAAESPKPDAAKPAQPAKTEPSKPGDASPFQPVAPAPAAAENPFQPVTPAKPAEPAKPVDPPKP